MKEFVDLQGASGAHYRFRLCLEGAPHPGAAGNFAYVREEPKGFSVLALGETNDFSELGSQWPAAKGRGATHLFTRLNVARALREAEHQDLDARYGGAAVSAAAS
jgi:hypothetical protein